MFLDLNRQRSYDSYKALESPEKDQADLLQPFQECRTDPFKALSERKASIKVLHCSELQMKLPMISLVRGLFELSGGLVNCRQHALDQGYTFNDNLNLYMILVGVTGTNQYGYFDPEKMHNALLESKVFFKNSDIGTLDMIKWSMQIIKFLPTGFPEGFLITLSRATSSTIVNINKIFRLGF